MRLTISHIAVAILASLFTVVAHADPLELTLEPGNAEGTVQVSLTNTGATALSVLRWDTPFEETLSSDVFHVERSGKDWPLVERAAYVGREVKRAAPSVDQYLVLEPGTTISQSIELNDYYRIDKADTRNVRFQGKFSYSEWDATSLTNSVRKTLSTVTLNSSVLESNSVQVNVAPQMSLRVVTPAYSNCSVQEQTDIIAAAQLAEDYVNTGIADLQSLAASERAGSPRYTTWFGAYSETRFNQVLSNYVAIGDALEAEQMKFDCGCSESGVYAYVYPSRPYDIFLCPAFRAAGVGGTDSRAGTIIHELSHFTVLADTDDHVYSQLGAQNLANSDPAKAISNADNHEYFAENTPALAILGTPGTTTPVDHQVLALDTPVSDSVALESSVTYQVSGASQITLLSTIGDADLYLYSDSALSAEICRSNSSPDSEFCEIFAQGTVYIEVYGYTAASYTLEATAGSTTTQPDSEGTLLTPNIEVSGALDEGERQNYEVTGAELINLESLSGDADLYVFNSQEFTDATLICASAEYSEDSTTDSCILPSLTATYYVLVVGYTVSDYTLIAVSSSGETDDTPATVDMGRLIVGEAASESVAVGQFHHFVVSGASSIELTSLTGDADLGVYATADYADDGLLCFSVEPSTESVVESCDIPSGADHYIAILGYEDSTYSLIATALPEDDDPTPEVPGTEVPGTEVPGTEVPGTEVPGTEVPGTEVPGTDVPGTEVPGTDVPGTDVPGTDVPGTDVPGTEVPGTEVPGTEVPGTEVPGTEVPGTEVPGTEVPGTEVPGTEVPGTEVPGTEVPGTQVPGTQVPVTVDPIAEVPAIPQAPDDSPVPVATPVASSGGSSGSGSLNFLGLGLLMLTVAYRRSAAKSS